MAEIGKPDRIVYPEEEEFGEEELIPIEVPQEEPIPLPEWWPLPVEVPVPK